MSDHSDMVFVREIKINVDYSESTPKFGVEIIASGPGREGRPPDLAIYYSPNFGSADIALSFATEEIKSRPDIYEFSPYF